ncbi:MAG: hypothetical protein Tsb002_07590 [Wenzhouxiangellaceae bacterium]
MIHSGLSLAAESALASLIADYQAAVTAFREGDDQAVEKAARAALAQAPDLATARYLLAVSLARQGWLSDAAQALTQLADQGLTTRLEAETAFAPLQSEARYAELRRQLVANRAALGQPQSVVRTAVERFVPEGIAMAPAGDYWLLGSVHQSRIIRVEADGEVSDWVRAGSDGLCSVLSLRYSSDGGSVYAATACMKETADIASEWLGRSGVFVYSAAGEHLASHWLPSDDRTHVFGDVLVWDEQTLVVSDSLDGAILWLDLASGKYRHWLAPGALPNPQGITRDQNGDGIYVADYQTGIYYLQPQQDAPVRMHNPQLAALQGIDGLVRCGKQLVAIQNGVRPNRIIALQLGADPTHINSGQVLARGLPGWDEPTQGLLDGHRLIYIANSHWPRFDASGALPVSAELDGPHLMALTIPDCQ